ncbi:MAG TPA: molybdenum cofactor guanylyltransferase, partial [Verrucomicrobiae bacterium]
MKFSAVILAGGRSQRMGQDKAWLPVDGKPLIARQIELARTLGAEEVFISGRSEVDYRSLNCHVLQDRVPDAGPLAGIESALAAISTLLLLVLAVDMPQMTIEILQVLLAHCRGNCGAIPRVEEKIEPLAAVYPRAALELARSQLDNGRSAARDFAERCVEQNLAAFVHLSASQAACFENW